MPHLHQLSDLLPTKATKLLRTLLEPRTPKTRQQQGTGMHSAFHRKKNMADTALICKRNSPSFSGLTESFHQSFNRLPSILRGAYFHKRYEKALLNPTESSAVLKCTFHCFRSNKNPVVSHRSNSATPHLLHAVKAHIKAKEQADTIPAML